MLERLHPRPGEVSAEDLVGALDLAAHAPRDRPYVVLNMVSTLDGKAAVDGDTRGLGGAVDRELFHLLRTQVDAVLIGAGTARVERYGAPVKSGELRARRDAQGRDPALTTVIVSGRLLLPPDLPVLQEPDERVVIATGEDRELEGVRAQVGYERTGDDLPLLLARLRSEHGIETVLCEGGPTLNAHMLAAGLVDELFLSIAPKIAGGEGAEVPSIVDGPPLPAPLDADLVWLCRAGSELFSRWRLRRA